MHRRSFLGQTGLLGSGLAGLGGCTPTSPWWVSDLKSRIPPMLKQTRTPGLSIAVVQSGKLAWSSGFGVRDLTTDSPVDEATVFQAASMSKPVFAYAVLKLCERGVMKLDTPLTTYMSERFLSGDARLDQITARHVLSHTSGFQNTRSGDSPLKIHFNPGEKWMYSGEGFAYLQSVVTHLTGKVDPGSCSQFEADLEVCGTDFEAFLLANVLQPLGMASSSYTKAPVSRLAHPHGRDGKAIAAPKLNAAAVARYGAMGGLFATARDYAQFLIAVMEPGLDRGARLSPASVAEMLRPQISVEKGDGYSISWSLGWRIAHTKGGDLAGHGGDNAGFHCLSQMSAARKCGFVIFTNGDGGVQLLQQLAPHVAKVTEV